MMAAAVLKFKNISKFKGLYVTNCQLPFCSVFSVNSKAFGGHALSKFTWQSSITLENNFISTSRIRTSFKLTCFHRQMNDKPNIVCWNCMESLLPTTLFCDKCNLIQRPSSGVNYFELFGIEQNFDVDALELARKFKSMQKLLHPDKFSNKSLEESKIAEEYSALVNDAYFVLKVPWSRGIYLLKAMGVDATEETTIDDPELLMTIMERNEDVLLASDLKTLLEIDEANKNDMGRVITLVSNAFKHGDFNTAKKLMYNLKYLCNIEEKLNEKKLTFGVS